MCSELMNDIISTSVGGAFGGAAAGLVIMLVQGGVAGWRTFWHGQRVYKWLEENSDMQKEPFRSTRALASYNNLPEDRVRFICSHHKNIKLSTGSKEDMWSIHIRSRSASFFTGNQEEK